MNLEMIHLSFFPFFSFLLPLRKVISHRAVFDACLGNVANDGSRTVKDATDPAHDCQEDKRSHHGGVTPICCVLFHSDANVPRSGPVTFSLAIFVLDSLTVFTSLSLGSGRSSCRSLRLPRRRGERDVGDMEEKGCAGFLYSFFWMTI